MVRRPGGTDGPQGEAGKPLETASGWDQADATLIDEFDEQEKLDGRDLIYYISKNIAEKINVDICELPPLNETIDPDALRAFLHLSDGSDTHPKRSVEFSYCGYRVLADSTGQVKLHPEPDSTFSTQSIRG